MVSHKIYDGEKLIATSPLLNNYLNSHYSPLPNPNSWLFIPPLKPHMATTCQKKRGYSLQLYCHKCRGTAARGKKKKKGFTKKKKKASQKLFQLPTISNCPDLCPLTHIGCWRSTELLLLPRTPSLSLERSVSRALSLFSISFYRFFLPLVLFVLVFFGRFSFSFFWWNKECEKWLPSLLVTRFLTERCFIWTPMASLRLSLYTSPWRGRRWFSWLLPVPSLRLAG